MPTDVNTLIQYAELASLLLTVLAGTGAIVVKVWTVLSHGHPDAMRDWIQEAVGLAVAIRDDGDKILGLAPNSPLEKKTVADIAGVAETYLHNHGISAHLDEATIQMVLAVLREAPDKVMGFQPPPKK